MKRRILITIIVLLTIGTVFAALSFTDYKKANNKLNELEVRLNDFGQNIVAETTHIYLTDPSYLFQFLEDHPEWEAIDSVPYSQCYQHLIATSIVDYIFCTAN